MNARAWQHLDFDDPTVAPALAVLDALQREEREVVRYRIPDGFSPYDEAVADEIIELQQRVLDALRKLVPPGERLAVVDPEDHHPPLLFHPHVRFEDVSRDRLWGYKHYVMPAWRVGLLPDGESWSFVGSDFAWEVLSPVTRPSELVIRGSRLLSTLDLASLRLLRRFELDKS
jgi:hypothetical protein